MLSFSPATFYISSVRCSPEHITLCVFKSNRKESTHTKTHTLTHIHRAENKAVSLTCRWFTVTNVTWTELGQQVDENQSSAVMDIMVSFFIYSTVLHVEKFCLFSSLRLWSNGNRILPRNNCSVLQVCCWRQETIKHLDFNKWNETY